MVIDPKLDGVFIHVTNMREAIAWYSRLLGLPIGDEAHEGMIYNLPLDGSIQVILDAYPKTATGRGTGPRVMFTTADIMETHRRVGPMSSTTSDVQDIGSSLVFYIEDPDGNLICIRQSKTG